MNLLTETTDKLKQLHLNVSDIAFIGTNDYVHSCTWERFRVLADLEYPDGYTGPHILQSLIIVFKDGSHLRRYEYDGSERWEYLPPVRTDAPIGLKMLSVKT